MEWLDPFVYWFNSTLLSNPHAGYKPVMIIFGTPIIILIAWKLIKLAFRPLSPLFETGPETAIRHELKGVRHHNGDRFEPTFSSSFGAFDTPEPQSPNLDIEQWQETKTASTGHADDFGEVELREVEAASVIEAEVTEKSSTESVLERLAPTETVHQQPSFTRPSIGKNSALSNLSAPKTRKKKQTGAKTPIAVHAFENINCTSDAGLTLAGIFTKKLSHHLKKVRSLEVCTSANASDIRYNVGGRIELMENNLFLNVTLEDRETGREVWTHRCKAEKAAMAETHKEFAIGIATAMIKDQHRQKKGQLLQSGRISKRRNSIPAALQSGSRYPSAARPSFELQNRIDQPAQ